MQLNQDNSTQNYIWTISFEKLPAQNYMLLVCGWVWGRDSIQLVHGIVLMVTCASQVTLTRLAHMIEAM